MAFEQQIAILQEDLDAKQRELDEFLAEPHIAEVIREFQKIKTIESGLIESIENTKAAIALLSGTLVETAAAMAGVEARDVLEGTEEWQIGQERDGWTRAGPRAHQG